MHCTGLSQPLNQPCQGLTEQKKEKCPSGANCRTLPHPPWSQASQQKGFREAPGGPICAGWSLQTTEFSGLCMRVYRRVLWGKLLLGGEGSQTGQKGKLNWDVTGLS